MESQTYLKNIKVSPKKMRMILPAIKKLTPSDSLDYLMYHPGSVTRIYYKAIHSAIHNAIITLKVDASVLQFKLFTIEGARVLKRFRPGSRGTAKPIKRKYSHIKIILAAKKQAKKLASEPKTEKVKIDEKKEIKAKEVKKPARKKVVKKEA